MGEMTTIKHKIRRTKESNGCQYTHTPTELAKQVSMNSYDSPTT